MSNGCAGGPEYGRGALPHGAALSITVVERTTDLPDPDREELRALSAAVYPPDEVRHWPGREVEWAAAEWCVRVRDREGTLVSYVGITLRDAEHDGAPVRVGGIGGVKTHPAARGHGHAARATERAIAFFHERGVDFGLLVCAPTLIPYLRRPGVGRVRGPAARATARRRGGVHVQPRDDPCRGLVRAA